MNEEKDRTAEEMDPDFVELTPEEKRRLDEADAEVNYPPPKGSGLVTARS